MIEQITLFDVDNKPILITFRSKYQRWKYENGYTKADAYSDIRCQNCKHLIISRYAITPSERNYYKCELLGLSGSSATDIRLSNVCKNFKCYIKEQTNDNE